MMTDQVISPGLLFIDDDEDLVAALSIVLERAGYRVRHAVNGEVGVRMAAEDRPDLVLLDFMMPEMNGFEACGRLRQLDGMADVPIVAMTAFGQNIGEIHGLQRDTGGLQDYLEKPVEPNVLLARLAAVLPA